MSQRELPPYLTPIATGLRFPEGPVALPGGGWLLVECWGGNLVRISPEGEYGVVAYLGGRPAGTAIGPDRRAYICNDGGRNRRETAEFGKAPEEDALTPGGGRIQVVDLETATFETLYTEASGWPIGAANDLVFDAHGGFYFTDFTKQNKRMMTRGRVCYAAADGSGAHDVVAPVDTANGVGLSPDGRTLYVAMAAFGRLMAYDLEGPGFARPDPKTGKIGRVLAQLPGDAGFDSLGVDSEGYICCATTGTGHVTIVAPDGSGYSQIAVGDTHVTNICWGGPDLSTAYLTLAGYGMLASTPWPRPGLALNYLNI